MSKCSPSAGSSCDTLTQALHLVAAGGKFGNPRFLGALCEEACDILVRLRRDLVLCGPPGSYQGRGRPRVHGQRFAFKDPETWGTPDTEKELDDDRWGVCGYAAGITCTHVRMPKQGSVYFRQRPIVSVSKPAAPLWLVYLHPSTKPHAELMLEASWQGYEARWPVAPSIRFRKQSLYWTLPRFQSAAALDRWTRLVTLAQWQLCWARDIVQDTPRPWQMAQQALTLDRTRQSLRALFQQIGTPARPPKAR
ncbi:MAG: hypothetical protein MUQ10_20120 [Anaerolineae bacterium]|nr:hypothetical protein [Anaerolineae bacterium]